MDISKQIERLLDRSPVRKIGDIQALWSGYGYISRYQTDDEQTFIVKHVRLPETIDNHPRGWNSSTSHQRKIRSYQVECFWYEHFATQSDSFTRMPGPIAVNQSEDSWLIVMEDLDAKGYSVRKQKASKEDILVCLKWLAYFHAKFLNHNEQNGKKTTEQMDGLWPIGTYWHLETRPDELAAMKDATLKSAALDIDKALNETPYLCVVHGDAKLANFCFADDSQSVAAVDFQYVGYGCGMKDVAYFMGSCLSSEECFSFESSLLDAYFSYLKQAIKHYHIDINVEDLECSWRPLYAYAWADFLRFVKGWSPDHWKIHDYSEALARQVVSDINSRT